MYTKLKKKLLALRYLHTDDIKTEKLARYAGVYFELLFCFVENRMNKTWLLYYSTASEGFHPENIIICANFSVIKTIKHLLADNSNTQTFKVEKFTTWSISR